MAEVSCKLSVKGQLSSVNGTVSNAVVETPVSNDNWVVHINGSNNSCVDFGTGVGQFGTNDFTVAFWVQTSERHRLFDLVGNRTAGSHGNFLAIRMTGNHESSPWGTVSAEIDQDERGTNYIGVNSQATGLHDGKWHHIAVVRQGTSLKLYIDGAMSASGSASGVANIANNNPFKIGRSLVGFDDKFAPDARYRDLRVFDEALTEIQVSRLLYTLQFDGVDDYIEIDEPFQNNTAFTISLWVKPAVLNDGRYHGFIGKYGDTHRKPGLWVTPNNSGLHYDSYAANGQRYYKYLNDFFAAPDQWVHVSWVKDGTAYRVYRNGELFATETAPEQFFTAATSYWIGRVDNFFSGQLNDVRIWSRTRSESEIKADMNQRLSGNEAGLSGYWPIKEGTGDRVADLSGKGHDGTIHGATWVQR